MPVCQDLPPTTPPVEGKLLYLKLRSDMGGNYTKPRISIARCIPFHNPHDTNDISKYLPVGLTKNVLNKLSTKPRRPDHVTVDDVVEQVQRLEMDNIVGR